MARAATVGPTPGELELLRILWTRGPSTCREIHESLPEESRVGYTTVLKLLQIMVAKGIAQREDGDGRSHRYEAAVTQHDTQRTLLRDLMDRAFGGSASELVLQALSAKPASASELAEIRSIIEQAKGAAR